MQKLHGIASIDTGYFRRLDGVYVVGDFVLTPCVFSTEQPVRGCSNFVVEFDFDGLDERPETCSNDPHEMARRSWINSKKAVRIASEFVAWLVLATGNWARLRGQNLGPAHKLGPFSHGPVDGFPESKLVTTHNADKSAKMGEFVEVERSLSSSSRDLGPIGSLKLPSDLPILTSKMLSLSKRKKEEFLNACFSYQFALENWSSYPTISILSLVSAVESMMVDEYSSSFCKYSKRKCTHKKDVMKKFREFFERNLHYPLPKEMKELLNSVYSRRSSFVHKALLGTGEARGIAFAQTSEKGLQLKSEQRRLEVLVRVGLIEWLRKI